MRDGGIDLEIEVKSERWRHRSRDGGIERDGSIERDGGIELALFSRPDPHTSVWNQRSHAHRLSLLHKPFSVSASLPLSLSLSLPISLLLSLFLSPSSVSCVAARKIVRRSVLGPVRDII